MNDSQTCKDIDLSTIAGAVMPGSTRTFERIVSDDPRRVMRRSAHISSLSPTDLRISHTMRKRSGDVQRSVAQIEQTLARLDASSNPISYDFGTFGFTATIPQGMSEAEFLAMVTLSTGWLLANSGANAKALYRGEF